MFNKQSKEIEKIIQDYFNGIYYGDIDKLDHVFYENVYLHGDINSKEYLKSKAAYLEGVKKRKSPDQLGEKFEMKILGIEIIGNVGVAKLHVPMLGYNYYDFLSFSKINEEWKIVGKIFSHVE